MVTVEAVKPARKTGLFVSCLVDLTRPQIGFATAALLERTGTKVVVPKQSCCGQPAYNNGNRAEAIDIAKVTIEAFQDIEHIVVPSASCAGMIKIHYPALFEDDTEWRVKAISLSQRTYELTEYLSKMDEVTAISAEFHGRIGYHESCSARRELKLTGARDLLKNLNGAQLIELDGNEECCGFGGLFSVKFDEISNAMVETKTKKINTDEIDILTGVDLGCLINLAGKLKQQGSTLPVRHISELLAGHTDTPPI